MGKWTKRIVYALIGLAVVAVVAVLAQQYIQGSVLRGLTNGQLEAADWSIDTSLPGDSVTGMPSHSERAVPR
jgi:hypothetical protein